MCEHSQLFLGLILCRAFTDRRWWFCFHGKNEEIKAAKKCVSICRRINAANARANALGIQDERAKKNVFAEKQQASDASCNINEMKYMERDGTLCTKYKNPIRDLFMKIMNINENQP